MNNLRNFGDNKVTGALLIINIAIFVIMSITGGTENTANLVRFGAMVKSLVAGGERRRLFTASFIHIGIMHLAFNMYFLYQIGPLFERLYGSTNFLIMYLLAGIMGNLMSFAFGSTQSVSAGASTSLYGMFGMALGMMLNYKNDEIIRNLGASFISIIVINVIYSLISPGIGVLGHLGGLLAGVILTGIFPIVSRQLQMSTQIISVAAFVILAILFIIIGKRSLY